MAGRIGVGIFGGGYRSSQSQLVHINRDLRAGAAAARLGRSGGSSSRLRSARFPCRFYRHRVQRLDCPLPPDMHKSRRLSGSTRMPTDETLYLPPLRPSVEFADRCCVRPEARQGARAHRFLSSIRPFLSLRLARFFSFASMMKSSKARFLRAVACARCDARTQPRVRTASERARSYHQLACISAGGTYRWTHRAAEVRSV